MHCEETVTPTVEHMAETADDAVQSIRVCPVSINGLLNKRVPTSSNVMFSACSPEFVTDHEKLVEMKPVKITSDSSLSTARTSKSVPIMSSIDGQSLDI